MAFLGQLEVFFLSLAKIQILYYISNQFIIKFYSFYDSPYTNETEGIYQNTPCIIFDDFTTDSKLVDFPFKVKSSAMKILKVTDDIEIEYVAMFMSIKRLIGDTHKRYWISEYSKLCIPIPPKEEQKRIINIVKMAFKKLDAIMENL